MSSEKKEEDGRFNRRKCKVVSARTLSVPRREHRKTTAVTVTSCGFFSRKKSYKHSSQSCQETLVASLARPALVAGLASGSDVCDGT